MIGNGFSLLYWSVLKVCLDIVQFIIRQVLFLKKRWKDVSFTLHVFNFDSSNTK